MNYLFINAAIKAKHHEFLSDSQLQNLNQTPTKDFLKTLNDYGYGFTSNTQTLDSFLNQEEKKLINNLEDWFGFNHNIVKVYKLLHDVVNIKIIFKQLYFNINIADTFDDFSFYEPNVLYSVLKYSNYDLVNDDLELFKSLNQIPRDLNVFDICNEITKIVYDYIYEKYIKKFDKYLKKYYQEKITLINILTVLRSMKLNFDIHLTKSMLLNNALISNEDIIDILYIKKNPKSLRTHLPVSFEKIILLVDYDKGFSTLSNEFEEFLIHSIGDFDFEINTLAPVLCYILKKKYEKKILRGLYYSSKQLNSKVFKETR